MYLAYLHYTFLRGFSPANSHDNVSAWLAPGLLQDEEEEQLGWRLQEELTRLRQDHEQQLAQLQAAADAEREAASAQLQSASDQLHGAAAERQQLLQRVAEAGAAAEAAQADVARLRGELAAAKSAALSAQDVAAGFEEEMAARDREIANLQVGQRG